MVLTAKDVEAVVEIVAQVQERAGLHHSGKWHSCWEKVSAHFGSRDIGAAICTWSLKKTGQVYASVAEAVQQPPTLLGNQTLTREEAQAESPALAAWMLMHKVKAITLTPECDVQEELEAAEGSLPVADLPDEIQTLLNQTDVVLLVLRLKDPTFQVTDEAVAEVAARLL